MQIPMELLTLALVLLAGIGGYLFKMLIDKVSKLDNRITVVERDMAVNSANFSAAIDKLTTSIDHAVESIDARVISYTQTIDKMIVAVVDQGTKEREKRTSLIMDLDQKIEKLIKGSGKQ